MLKLTSVRFFVLVMAFFTTRVLHAELPVTHQIPSIDVLTIRKAYNEIIQWDLNTSQRFHPYFVESVNTILSIYLKDFRLKKYLASGADTTVNYYLQALKAKGITVYKLNGLKGKVLRAFISSNIPILLIGKHRDLNRQVTRVHGDILYGFRPPDITQSSKTLPEERKYIFYTARGFCLEGKEGYGIEKKEIIRLPPNQTPSEYGKDNNKNAWDIYDIKRDLVKMKSTFNSPQKAEPFHYFEYTCIITTPKLTLEKAKKGVNQSLAGVGFDYPLPEFEEINPRVLD